MTIESCDPKGIDAELVSFINIKSPVLEQQTDHFIEALCCSYQKQEHAILPDDKVEISAVSATKDDELPAVILLYRIQKFPLLLVQVVDVVEVHDFEVRWRLRGLIYNCIRQLIDASIMLYEALRHLK